MILPAETLDSLVDALRRRDKATTEYNGFLIEVTSEADDTSLREIVRGWYHDTWHPAYVGIVVTVSRLCPCCHELREVATESLWGVESYASADYVAEVVRDLLADIETEDTADATH